MVHIKYYDVRVELVLSWRASILADDSEAYDCRV